MTPQELAQHRANVMLQWAAGKTVQMRWLRGGNDVKWEDDTDPIWDWCSYDYQVKREPREWWVNDYGEHMGSAFIKRETCDQAAGAHNRVACIKVREVID